MTRATPRPKRQHGEGSVTKLRTLENGNSIYEWAIRVVLPTGERRRLKGRTECRRQEDARQAMYDAKANAMKGTATRLKTLKVTELLDEWLAMRETCGNSPRTYELQAALIRLHIRPRMGRWKVAAVTADAIEDFHANLLRETQLERTREQVHVILKMVFSYAVRRQYLSVNPTREVKVPRRQERREQRRVKTWTPEQASLLLDAAMQEGSALGYAVALGLRTGMRIGEVFGLRWVDVDLDRRQLRVEQVLSTHGPKSRSITHPKTDKSRRTIPLSDKVIELLHLVRDLQRRQGHPDAEYVFTTRKGEMQHPGNANRFLKLRAERLNIPAYSFHALRHGFVSLAAHQGYSIEEVAVYVGHADSNLTRRTYLHFWPEHRKAIDLAV